jgi:hypothetical protein
MRARASYRLRRKLGSASRDVTTVMRLLHNLDIEGSWPTEITADP